MNMEKSGWNSTSTSKRILVMGGTYFLGKAFVELACNNHSITVFNRGTRALPVEIGTRITSIQGDRRNPQDLQKLQNMQFDCIVDFCAYAPEDIRNLLENLKASLDHAAYIFISTCDVYQRGTGHWMTEDGLLEERVFPGEAGEYIAGKVALEKELQACQKEYSITPISIRPAFIYGPDNYAPREEIFFHWITQAGQVIIPAEADGHFQFVYSKDVAKAILYCCTCNKLLPQILNLCGEELLTYQSFADYLEKATQKSIQVLEVPNSVILEKGIPLPFPFTKEESEQYKSTVLEDFLPNEFQFTPIEEGLRETYQWFLM